MFKGAPSNVSPEDQAKQKAMMAELAASGALPAGVMAQMNRGMGDAGTPAQINIYSTTHVTESGDAKETEDAVKRGVSDAVFQNPALNSFIKGSK